MECYSCTGQNYCHEEMITVLTIYYENKKKPIKKRQESSGME